MDKLNYIPKTDGTFDEWAPEDKLDETPWKYNLGLMHYPNTEYTSVTLGFK